MAAGPADEDGFLTNISVERREVAPDLTATRLFAEAKKRLVSQRLPGLKLTRELSAEIGGCPAHDLEFTHDDERPDESGSYTRRLVCLISGGSAYEIVFTATTRGYRAGGREQFERFLSDLAP